MLIDLFILSEHFRNTGRLFERFSGRFFPDEKGTYEHFFGLHQFRKRYSPSTHLATTKSMQRLKAGRRLDFRVARLKVVP
jgi:hypothetical protein